MNKFKTIGASLNKKRLLIVGDQPTEGTTSGVFIRMISKVLGTRYKTTVFCLGIPVIPDANYAIEYPEIDTMLVNPGPNPYRPAVGDELGQRSLPKVIKKFSPDGIIFVYNTPDLARIIKDTTFDCAKIIFHRKDQDVSMFNKDWLKYDIEEYFGVEQKVYYKYPQSKRDAIRQKITERYPNFKPDSKLYALFLRNEYGVPLPDFYNEFSLLTWPENTFIYFLTDYIGSFKSMEMHATLKIRDKILVNIIRNDTKLDINRLSGTLNAADVLLLPTPSTLEFEATATETPVVKLYELDNIRKCHYGRLLDFETYGLPTQQMFEPSNQILPKRELKEWDKIAQDIIISILGTNETFKSLKGTKAVPEFDTSVIQKFKNEESMRILYMSTYKEECGIAEYTSDLSNAVAKCYPDAGIGILKERYNMGKIVDILTEMRPHVLHIQHEYGIMLPTMQLIDLFRLIKQKGTKVAITLHTTDMHDTEAIIKSADFTFLHGSNKEYEGNVIHIPHPICINRLNLEKDPKKKIIGTTGFIAPLKGLDATMDAFKPHLLAHPDLELHIVCALHSTERMKVYALEILDKYNNDKNLDPIRDRIKFISDFLPLDILSAHLSKFNLGFSWVMGNTRSNSGSASRIIGCGIPTIVSPSTHFKFLVDSKVARIGPANINEFVELLVNTVYDESELGSIQKELDANLERMGYEAAAKEHMDVYTKILQA